jgi:hypothetical protein
MTNNSYGLNPENPLKLNNSNAAMGYLQHLVTKHDGYHILFHRLGTMEYNLFDESYKRLENPVEHYQICTGDETLIDIFIDIHCDECLWIPPAPFDFESDSLLILDKEMTEESEAEYTVIKVDKKYVSKIRENWIPNDYDSIDPDSMEYILYRSWGVNYKTENFPHDLWETYVNENTFCISDLNKEELEQHNKMLVDLLINDFNLKDRLN